MSKDEIAARLKELVKNEELIAGFGIMIQSIRNLTTERRNMLRPDIQGSSSLILAQDEVLEQAIQKAYDTLHKKLGEMVVTQVKIEQNSDDDDDDLPF